MNRFISVGAVCRLFGISLSTAYRRIKAGTLVSAFRTSRGHRRFDVSVVDGRARASPVQRVVTYARVSSADQRSDLDCQSEKLKRYAERHFSGAEHIHIADLGSGLNYRKKGLRQLLTLLIHRQMDVLILNHKDRLLRFGSELVFQLCAAFGVEVVIVKAKVEQSFEQELAQDVIELMTVFCARLYGKRSHSNKHAASSVSKMEKPV